MGVKIWDNNDLREAMRMGRIRGELGTLEWINKALSQSEDESDTKQLRKDIVNLMDILNEMWGAGE